MPPRPACGYVVCHILVTTAEALAALVEIQVHPVSSNGHLVMPHASGRGGGKSTYLLAKAAKQAGGHQ